MPRTARASAANYCYHALNRGNGRARVFHDEDDYRRFVGLIAEAGLRVPMRVLACCLMPKHFHLALWPKGDGDLGRRMHRLLTAHVGRHRRRYRTSGHIWRGRFAAFPIQEDDHLLTVLRYVERNPLRAGLVERAEDRPWSSLPRPGGSPPGWLDPGPVPRGADWLSWVNATVPEPELGRLRAGVARGVPYGTAAWIRRAADRLGLGSSLRDPGRPRLTTP